MESPAAFGEYVRSKPWAKRIAGIRPSWGTYTEWHTFGIMNGPDASPLMTKRFRGSNAVLLVRYARRQGV